MDAVLSAPPGARGDRKSREDSDVSVYRRKQSKVAFKSKCKKKTFKRSACRVILITRLCDWRSKMFGVLSVVVNP